MPNYINSLVSSVVSVGRNPQERNKTSKLGGSLLVSSTFFFFFKLMSMEGVAI